MRHVVSIPLLAASIDCADPRSPSAAPASPATPEAVEPPPKPSAQRSAAFDAAVVERTRERDAMVDEQLASRDIADARVLAAMRRVPRHAFVPAELQAEAYDDRPLPIGYDATISQPYIVALMTDLAHVQPGDRVLDVGTGSGYQAAVLAELGARVYAIEIVPELVALAKERFDRLGLAEIDLVQGDGWKGRSDHAPYDAIIVAAAPDELPQALVDQLADGGTMVIPTGRAGAQRLRVITKQGARIEDREVAVVAFVPLVRGD